MKKQLISLLTICIIAISAAAQSNEFFVSYGVAPQGLGNTPSSWRTIASVSSSTEFPFVHPTYDDKQTGGNNGAFTVGYMHKVVAGLSFGASYSYFTTSRHISYDEADLKMDLADCTKKNHVVLALAKYQWLNIGRFSLYSRAGVGVKISSSYTINVLPQNVGGKEYGSRTWNGGTKDYAYVAYQVMPLGVDFRVVPFVYIFAEGGYGSTGCFQCGIKTKF
ncbi:MAG: hypothetical protein K2J74_07830 [Muribaculaceae bacterium]|nr:hypothetical protein [Muribaculaceae bacterium]